MNNTINTTSLQDMYRLTRDAKDFNNPVSKLLQRAMRYNAILEIISNTDTPLRCKEIAARMPDSAAPWTGYNFDYNDVMHLVRFMARDNIAERKLLGYEKVHGHDVAIYGYILKQA